MLDAHYWALSLVEMYGCWAFEPSGDEYKEESRKETRIKVFRARSYLQLQPKEAPPCPTP